MALERVQLRKPEFDVGAQCRAHDGIAVKDEASETMLSLNHDAAATRRWSWGQGARDKWANATSRWVGCNLVDLQHLDG
jgi:hypothetical protein